MNGDYLLLGTVYVDLHASKCRLTIEPGNTILCSESFGIVIGDSGDDGGELYAEGTVDSVITFTSANGNPGGWNGIYFHNASDYAGSTSHLQHCIIENGNDRNIYLNTANSIIIEDCFIRDSANNGIHNHNSHLTISNTEITGNGNYPIYYNHPAYIRELINLNIHDNALDFIASETGTIGSDRRWRYCNVPYLFLGNLILEKTNATFNLTIDPGCTLKFDHSILRIGDGGDDGAELHAIGTADSLITFTAANDSIGGWMGINFNPSSDYYSSVSQLQHCVIEKGDTYNIYFNAASNHIIDNCLIQDSAGNGIDVNSSNINLSNIQVENNAGYGLINNFFNLFDEDVSTFQFSNNGMNSIGLGGNISAGDIYIPYWSYGYSVLGDVTMETTNGVGARLTFAPGNTLRFDEDCILKIGDDSNDGGELYAVGTPDSIITFTSLNDSIGGWTGIYFDDVSNYSTCSSELNYCNIENSENYNIYCYATDEPTMDHITSSNSLTYGLRCNNANPTATISRFVNNEQYGVYLQGTSNPNIGNDPVLTCDLFGNTLYDVYNETASNRNFLHNFWNSTDSTYIDTRIWDKYDDPARGYIYFMPVSATSLYGNYPPEQFSLLSPTDNGVVDSAHPTFYWQQTSDPESYPIEYEFMYTSDSTWVTYNVSPIITDTTYTLPDTLSGINHFWWKIAAYDEYLTTYSSETWKFTVSLEPSVPDPILPLTGDYMTSADYLVWLTASDPDEGDDVSHYHIMIDNNDDFSSPEIDMTNIGLSRENSPTKTKYGTQTENYRNSENANKVADASHRDYAYAVIIEELTDYENLLDNTYYFWKISAVDGYGVEGEFSDGSDNFIYFADGVEMSVVENITLTGTENSIEINWSPVTQDIYDNPVTISHYNLYRSTEPDFTPGAMVYLGNTVSTTYTDSNVLIGNDIYFYIVTAVIGLDDFNRNSEHNNSHVKVKSKKSSAMRK